MANNRISSFDAFLECKDLSINDDIVNIEKLQILSWDKCKKNLAPQN